MKNSATPADTEKLRKFKTILPNKFVIDLDECDFDYNNLQLELKDKYRTVTYTLNINRLVSAGIVDLKVVQNDI